VLFEDAACAFVGEIAGRQPGRRHGALDDLLGRWCKPQLHTLGLALSGWLLSALSG
jgi:hypothetical protein